MERMERTNVMVVGVDCGRWNLVNSEEEMKALAEKFFEKEKDAYVEYGTVGAFKVSKSKLQKIKDDGGYFFDGYFEHYLEDYQIHKWVDKDTKKNVMLLVAQNMKEAEETEMKFDVDDYDPEC